ncbi:MAG: hypothetical protein JSU07_00920 [Bacteroidetes bacterium]|nr:hypothetical protein [Bacteroidota bacterium]
MTKKIIFLLTILMCVIACNHTTENETEISERQNEINDSISKLRQRKHADSMKLVNPLLIIPPDSLFTGDYIDKYPSGITKYRGYFRLGKRHGQWLSFYPNGNPWSEMSYDKGLREGQNITYFNNGKVRYKGFFKNDEKDSVWTFYDSLGTVIQTNKFAKGK